MDDKKRKGTHWDVLEFFRNAQPWAGAALDEAHTLCMALDDLEAVKAPALADCLADWVPSVALTPAESAAVAAAINVIDDDDAVGTVRVERHRKTLRARVVTTYGGPSQMVVTEEVRS